MVSVFSRLSMSTMIPPGCKLISAIAVVSEISSLVRIGTLMMAVGGGSARRMASQETLIEAFTKSIVQEPNSRTMPPKLMSSALFGGIGMARLSNVATRIPESTLANVTSPHSMTQIISVNRNSRIEIRGGRFAATLARALLMSFHLLLPTCWWHVRSPGPTPTDSWCGLGFSAAPVPCHRPIRYRELPRGSHQRLRRCLPLR